MWQWVVSTVARSVKQRLSAGHPSHQTPSIDGVSTDVNMPNPVEYRLLQRCASLCTDRHTQKLLRVLSNISRIVLQASRRSRAQLYIGCQFISGSHTSWQFWRTKFGAHPVRVTCTTESWNDTFRNSELYVRQSSRCWCSQPFTSMRYINLPTYFQHRVSDSSKIANSVGKCQTQEIIVPNFPRTANH